MIDTDEQTIRALREAMSAEVRGHHLDPEIATAALSQVTGVARAPRRRVAEYVAIAACLVGVAVLAIVYGATRSDRGTGAAGPTRGSSCAGAVVTSTLPVWAQSGFSPDALVNPHVTGARDEIIGVLFTDPLRSPQVNGRQNKILWVAKDHGNSPLTIKARLDGSTRTATRTVVDGPGPSIIDMPVPGCWQMTLHWSGHTDTVSLPYSG